MGGCCTILKAVENEKTTLYRKWKVNILPRLFNTDKIQCQIWTRQKLRQYQQTLCFANYFHTIWQCTLRDWLLKPSNRMSRVLQKSTVYRLCKYLAEMYYGETCLWSFSSSIKLFAFHGIKLNSHSNDSIRGLCNVAFLFCDVCFSFWWKRFILDHTFCFSQPDQSEQKIMQALETGLIAEHILHTRTQVFPT